MKLTKKLLPAFGMLLLSACMMVTSTFAWFSMNESVKATNMTVTAKGDQVYLQIVNDKTEFANGSAQTQAQATVQTSAILPVNVVNKIGTEEQPTDETVCTPYAGDGTLVWVTNIGKSTLDGTAKTNYSDVSGTANTPIKDDGGNITGYKYYLKNTFSIRLDPTAGATTAANPLSVSTVTAKTVDATNPTFQKCMNVLIVCTYDSTTKGCIYEFNGTNFAPITGASPVLTTNKFEAGKTATIEVYVFFNGDNEFCTQDNLAKAANGGYEVEIDFTVA